MPSTNKCNLDDDENLAGEVEKFPCLYDKGHSDYKDKGIKEQSWNIIDHNLGFAQGMSPTFQKFRINFSLLYFIQKPRIRNRKRKCTLSVILSYDQNFNWFRMIINTDDKSNQWTTGALFGFAVLSDFLTVFRFAGYFMHFFGIPEFCCGDFWFPKDHLTPL